MKPHRIVIRPSHIDQAEADIKVLRSHPQDADRMEAAAMLEEAIARARRKVEAVVHKASADKPL